MSQMEVGQTGYLSTDAIAIMNNCEVFINTGSSISQIKNPDTKHTLPITRTGLGKTDFEIDFYTTSYFFNNEVDEETEEKYKKNPRYIGPFPIEVEIYRALSYREQLYPRMDLSELISDLVLTNQYIEDMPDNEVYLEDKKQLRILIKEKLKTVSIKELEIYQKTFEPFSEEESDGGAIKNYAEDRGIVNRIIQYKQILKAQQGLEEMSVEELKKELEISNSNEDFERSTLILQIMNIKKGLAEMKQ